MTIADGEGRKIFKVFPYERIYREDDKFLVIARSFVILGNLLNNFLPFSPFWFLFVTYSTKDFIPSIEKEQSSFSVCYLAIQFRKIAKKKCREWKTLFLVLSTILFQIDGFKRSKKGFPSYFTGNVEIF